MLNAAKKQQQKGGFKRKHTNRSKIKNEKQTNKNGWFNFKKNIYSLFTTTSSSSNRFIK